MPTSSLLSEQIQTARARQAERGEEDRHERRNSQASPPSGLPLQPGATTPLQRDGPPLQPVILRGELSTDHSDAIKPLHCASTAPEQSYPSELKSRTSTCNTDVFAKCSQTADLILAMVSLLGFRYPYRIPPHKSRKANDLWNHNPDSQVSSVLAAEDEGFPAADRMRYGGQSTPTFLRAAGSRKGHTAADHSTAQAAQQSDLAEAVPGKLQYCILLLEPYIRDIHWQPCESLQTISQMSTGEGSVSLFWFTLVAVLVPTGASPAAFGSADSPRHLYCLGQRRASETTSHRHLD